MVVEFVLNKKWKCADMKQIQLSRKRWLQITGIVVRRLSNIGCLSLYSLIKYWSYWQAMLTTKLNLCRQSMIRSRRWQSFHRHHCIINSLRSIYMRRHPRTSLDECCNIVNWALGNKLQWKLNRNLKISINENAFENVVYEVAAA